MKKSGKLSGSGTSVSAVRTRSMKRKNSEDKATDKSPVKRAKAAPDIQKTVPKILSIPDHLVIKCRSKTLVEIIGNLKPKQREAVKEIGFGGLLELQVTSIPHKIVPFFVKHFNSGAYLFKASASGIRFQLSKDDVHDIFGLPSVGDEVELVAIGPSSLSSQDTLKAKWRRKFGIHNNKDGIPVHKLAAWISSTTKSGKMFKRMFVLYSMSVFLAPTSNHVLDLSLLRAVQKVSRIPYLDWCSYIFKTLVKGVTACRDGAVNLRGCILVLMLAYFHRVQFRGDAEQRDVPLIKHWDNSKLANRAKAEIETGSLGNGTFTEDVYPICKHAGARHSDQSLGEIVTRPQSNKKYLELPAGIETDEKIRARAVDDFHGDCMMMKRDIDIFYLRYVERRASMTSKMRPSSANVVGRKTTPVLSQTPPSLMGYVFRHYFERVGKKVEDMKEAADDIPSFEF